MADLDDLFGEDDGQQKFLHLPDETEVVAHLEKMMEEGNLSVRDVIRIFFAIMWPAESPDSQDVRPQLAMFFTEHGCKELTKKLPQAYIIDAGPVLGLALAHDPDQGPLTDDDKAMIARAVTVILQSGGLQAELVNGKIMVRNAKGETRQMAGVDVDVEVGKFRSEIDDELGPSHDPDNPWSRWMA